MLITTTKQENEIQSLNHIEITWYNTVELNIEVLL